MHKAKVYIKGGLRLWQELEVNDIILTLLTVTGNIMKKLMSALAMVTAATVVHADSMPYDGLGSGVAGISACLFGAESTSGHGFIAAEAAFLWASESETPWFIGPAINASYYGSNREDDDDDEDDDVLWLLRADLVGGKYITDAISAHVRLGAVTDQYFDGGAPSAGIGAGVHVNEQIKVVPEVIFVGAGLGTLTNYSLMVQYLF